MFVLANFINAVAIIVEFVLSAYIWIILARAVLSWVNANPYSPFVRSLIRFIYDITDPLLQRIRRWMPFTSAGIDFSPVILILAVTFLQTFLVPTLREIAHMLL